MENTKKVDDALIAMCLFNASLIAFDMIAGKQKYAAKMWAKRYKNVGRNMWKEICVNSPDMIIPEIYEELSLDVYNLTSKMLNDFVEKLEKSINSNIK
jgi:hypothetical protein